MARFTQPTSGEVSEYCTERGNNIDGEAFVDFYASKGWVVGKSPMKDWKAAVRTWERRNNGSQEDNRSRAKRFSDKLDEIAKKDIAQKGYTDILD